MTLPELMMDESVIYWEHHWSYFSQLFFKYNVISETKLILFCTQKLIQMHYFEGQNELQNLELILYLVNKIPNSLFVCTSLRANCSIEIQRISERTEDAFLYYSYQYQHTECNRHHKRQKSSYLFIWVKGKLKGR